MALDSERGKSRTASGVSYSLILGCFFLSGAAGLIYEVVWARQLSLFLGITSFAHTAVITAYMAGLAAGSLFFGRWADNKSSPLRVYAWLELGICVYALMTPWMFDLLQAGYAGIAGVSGIAGMPAHLGRFAIALLALLVPTFLMGGTLPLLVRGFVKTLPELGRATSRLYGINTLGAMTGTLMAGYFLLPKFGIVIATFTGVVINLGIAVVVLRMTRSEVDSRPSPAREQFSDAGEQVDGLPIKTRIAILLGFGLAGFASLLTQLAWIRALILVIGGSVYAFTITLASFLAGIGLGSLLYARFLSTTQNATRLKQAAILALLIGFTLLLGLPLIGQLPQWFMQGFEQAIAIDFAVFQLFVFSLCFVVMILPTLFMGALFPLVTVIWTSSNQRAGQGVGNAYAINTVGTIFGALLGGLFILPWLGAHTSIMLTSSIYIFVALVFWMSTGRSGIRQSAMPAVFSVSLFVLVAWLIPPWDKLLMASGVYYRAQVTSQLMKERSLDDIVADAELLYYSEGLDGTVTVKRQDGDRYLAVNGKTDASSRGDLPTQILLGQLPLQLDRDIRNTMVIGLGSGITAGTMTSSESIESLTVLEISAEVVEASGFFAEENYRVLEDPRVKLVTADARNFMLASDERFDLIVSEPSNPWISGISNLFTAEFFALASSRLSPDGIMTQWFHAYSMSEDDFRAVLRAFSDQFVHVTIWNTLPGDLVMMGSQQPHSIELNHANWVDEEDIAARELTRGGVNSAQQLLQHFIVGGEALKQYVAGAPINSDKHPIVEFNAPRNLYASTERSNLESVFKFLNGQNISVPVVGLYTLDQERLSAPSLGLDILAVEEWEMTEISERWLQAWQPIVSDEKEAFKRASLGLLTWREGETEYYLQASSHTESIPSSELVLLLSALMRSDGEANGEFLLNSGGQGVWSAITDPANQHQQLGLAWTCTDSMGDIRQFALISIMAETTFTSLDDSLEQLQYRIICH